MSDTIAIHQTKACSSLHPSWNVMVHDDPVNLMGYVTMVFMKVFGYDHAHASKLMLEVHHQGCSVVWSGGLEKAEFYAQQLQLHQLKTSLEIAE